MIFIKVNDDKRVVYRNAEYVSLSDERKEKIGEGILVDSIPEPEQIEGKAPILYCNPETKELWYEYEDIPPTKEELLEQKIQAQERAIAELTALLSMMMGGAN